MLTKIKCCLMLWMLVAMICKLAMTHTKSTLILRNLQQFVTLLLRTVTSLLMPN